jgi:hypothetical protein
LKEFDKWTSLNLNVKEGGISQIAVLHIPHSSWHVPVEERQAILLDDAPLNSELLRMTNAYTDALFPLTPVEAVSLSETQSG